ncbi:MAG: DUF2007 domain-containing protein [Candidatus Hydrogenedentota bacterium]
MEERYVNLMSFDHEHQAQYYRERLENAGIAAHLANVSTRDTVTSREALPKLGGPIQLQVREEDAKRAGELLAESFDDRLDGENPAIM